MKKLKLDLQSLNAEVLTRSQLKQILGGDAGSGGCAMVYSDQGYSSCYYTNDPYDLCYRVYGDHCNATKPDVDCASNNCTMN